MNVPFVAYDNQHKKYRKEIEGAMLRVARSRARILQNEVKTFEERFAAYVGTKYAVGVASGTDALFLSLKLAGVGLGDEVITVGHTFHATVEAIKWNGAKPVLVDVGEDGMMDIKCAMRAITEKTKAMLPVHLMGDMADMNALFNRFGGPIIEDACQALGASIDGKKAGSWGLAGCFSFFPAKILGCYGDGGAVTTNDEGLAKELKDMREHYRYNPGKYGFNSRLDELQAAILNVKLNHIDEILKRRQEVADIYNATLTRQVTIPTIRLGRVYQDYIIRIPNGEVSFEEANKYGIYPVGKRRNDLADFLKENGIETMKNDYHFPADLPKPEATTLLESQTLRLPCSDILTDKEVKYVSRKINQFFEE